MAEEQGEPGVRRASMRPGPTTALPRFEGPRAESAYWSSALEDAVLAGDASREREACEKLARLYLARGTDLDSVVKLSLRALQIADDPVLRSDLAGWLAGLGDPATAALELRASEMVAPGTTRARTLVRVAVLLARASRPDGALLVLEEAADVDPADPMPCELVGLLASWASEVVSPHRGAQGYLEAARRRRSAGDAEGAMEDLLRAFELAPTSADAAEAVSGALAAEGRSSAADELLREHAAALEESGRPEEALAVHLGRLAAAVGRKDPAAALSVALDLGVASEMQGVSTRLDEAIARAGLYELCAARLWERARISTGAERTRAFEALAKLYEGPLASADRAIDAHVAAAGGEPPSRDSLAALRDHASRMGDHRPLAEALLRVVRQHGSKSAEAAAELAALAEGPLDDPELAFWALSELGGLGGADAAQAELGQIRVEARRAERAAELARAEAAVDRGSSEGAGMSGRDARLAALRRLEKLYGMSPAVSERAFAVVASIARADPSDERAARSLEWLYARDPDADVRADLFESVQRARLEGSIGERERLRVSTAVARFAMAAAAAGPAAAARALEVLAPLLVGPDPDARTASAVLHAATAAGAPREEARALLILGRSLSGPAAAVVFAAASEAWHRAASLGEARRAAEHALTIDPSCARAASALARAAAALGGREGALVLERALGVAVTRAWLCDALARCLESIGEIALAFAWTQRWLALAPGDARGVGELLRRCQLGSDARRIADALGWVLAQPAPAAGQHIEAFLEGLGLLFGLDKVRGGQLARRALDVYGPRDGAFRNKLVALADDHGDEALAIATLERWVAADPERPEDVFVDLAARRIRARDLDGAAREVARAFLAGVDARVVLDVVDDIERVDQGTMRLGSDGLVSLAETRANALADMMEDDTAEHPTAEVWAHVAEAWRMLGALRWDVAADPRGSEQALFRAAEHDLERGFERYVNDVFELVGSDDAIAALFERMTLVADEPQPIRVALGLAVAHVATEHGLASWALDAACHVLEIAPGHPEAISIAEMHAPDVGRGPAAIDKIYEDLGATAMGVYGRRAAHYRAARQLEALGAPALALKHALRAFAAVPTEGTNFVLLKRLVDPVRGSEDAVAMIEAFADRARPEERTGLFRKALELCGTDRAGLARRLDVSLRALAASPEPSLVTAVADAFAALGAAGEVPADARDRLGAVADRVLPTLEGPDGARTAALLALALVSTGGAGAAIGALRRAVDADGDVEVYDKLREAAGLFASAPEEAHAFTQEVLERSKNKHVLVGPPLLRLASAVADALADGPASSALLAEAERREAPEPEDGARVHEDPFADPAMFGSEPPAEPVAASSPAPAENAEPAPSPPDLEPTPSAPEVAVVSASPESVDAALGAQREEGFWTSLASEAPSPADETPIKDGFAALFDQGEPPAVSAEDGELEEREAEARARGDHEAVSELLHRRIVASTWTEQVRVLKLRRAVVLDERLDRREDARRELEDILAENPDDRSALALLADLREKQGEHADAAPLWDQVSRAPGLDEDQRREYALRAARAHVAAGRVSEALAALERAGPSAEAARVRIDALELAGDRAALVAAIDAIVGAGGSSDADSAAFLVQAARASLALGDEQGALSRAKKALALAPSSADAVLESIRIDYLIRGTGTPREAQAVVDALGAVAAGLREDQIPLHTFLLAEALDVIQGGGAGMRELSKRHAEIGPKPLIALGMAERLARSRSFESAVPLFSRALEGDLSALRPRGRVALGAFDAALWAGSFDEARSFLEEASKAAELKPHIERRKRELLALDGPPELARPVLEQLVQETSGATKARFMRSLGALLADSDVAAAIETLESAMQHARRDRSLAERIRADLVELLEKYGPESASIEELASDPGRISDAPGPGVPVERAPESEPAPDRHAIQPGDPVTAEEPEPEAPAEERSERRRVPPLGSLAPSARPTFESHREERLFEELCAGFPEAADDLAAAFGDGDDRARDVLVVRRHQAALLPGHRPTLELLREAAIADRDEVYARALEHVLRAFARTVVEPPPLAAQPREPELLSALLFRRLACRETEVLAAVWECGMFRRELASYGLSGSDRVPLTVQSVLGQAYSELAAHLGSPRPIFHKRGTGPVSVGIALLSQPALIVSGEVSERSADLYYALAAAHATATSELVLAASLPDDAIERLFKAVSAAFGPIDAPSDEGPASSSSAAFRADVARIAEELWKRVSPKIERRLQELCAAGALDLGAARRAARTAMRRAGLYGSGNVAAVLRFVLAELGVDERVLSEADALQRLCDEHPEVADIVRLACSLEFAEARWQPLPPSSVRR